MNFNSFTIKSQEAIQKALELTRSAGQQQIEPVHLLKAIMLEGEALVKFIFQKVGANMGLVSSRKHSISQRNGATNMSPWRRCFWLFSR